MIGPEAAGFAMDSELDWRLCSEWNEISFEIKALGHAKQLPAHKGLRYMLFGFLVGRGIDADVARRIANGAPRNGWHA